MERGSPRKFQQLSAYGPLASVSNIWGSSSLSCRLKYPARAKLSETLSNKLDDQINKYALTTDSHLRLIGTPPGDVYALGDCSTVQNNVAETVLWFLRTIAEGNGKDPSELSLSFSEWQEVATRIKTRFPQTSDHLRRLHQLFQRFDRDHSGSLDYKELSELLHYVDTKLTTLPATAQRASQQGVYLGRKFTKIAAAQHHSEFNGVDYKDLDEMVSKAFKYRHLGNGAYIGNAAIFDLGSLSFGGGLYAVYLWRGIYFAESVSFRTRCMLAMDWVNMALFGRGESKDLSPGEMRSTPVASKAKHTIDLIGF